MRLRPVAVLDAWSADGETVLLLDGRILLLSALAAVLVDCFGEPEDPEAAMAAVVDELSAAGLVEVAP